jgi:hypothetical protein
MPFASNDCVTQFLWEKNNEDTNKSAWKQKMFVTKKHAVSNKWQTAIQTRNQYFHDNQI